MLLFIGGKEPNPRKQRKPEVVLLDQFFLKRALAVVKRIKEMAATQGHYTVLSH